MTAEQDLDGPAASGPPSDRVRLRRGAARADYDPTTVHAILDEGLIAHVGVSSPGGPVVLPMAYGRTDSDLYLHGAVANALLGSGADQDVCVTVTLVDGLVLARTPFHNSMNYRSVVIRGTARVVEDPDERVEALRLISDHVVATWDTGRPPSETDLRRTLVLAVALAEASAKVRGGDPVDEPEDLAGPWWAGTVAITRSFGSPVAAADLVSGIDPPPAVTARFGAG